MSAPLLAGVAVGDITPPRPVAMAGFAARTEPSTGVHDRLSVRAVALDDGRRASIVLAADLVMLTVDQCDRLRRAVGERTGTGPQAVIVSVTHTHAGPHVSPDALGPGADLEYVAWLEAELVTTAVRAWEAREPARIGHASGHETTVAQHRRRPGEAVDTTVTVVRVDDAEGGPLAVLFSYACHPVVLGPSNLLMSADWPGPARARVEERLPGAVAVFLQGCCGDVNTGHSAHDSMDPSKSDRRTFAEADRLGALVGDVAADLAESIDLTGDTTAAGTGAAQYEVDLPFAAAPSPEDLDRFDAEVDAELAGPVSHDRGVVLRARRSWLQGLRAPAAATSVPAVVTAHRWGGLTVVTMPGEPFGQIAADVRANAPDRDVLVLGYCNGVPGYLPHPPDEYAFGGYEVQEAHCFYGQPQCFDPTCGPTLVQAAGQAVDRLDRDAP